MRVGDEVLRGQLLARAEDERAVPLHAPATGRIARLFRQADFVGGTVEVIELAPLAGDTQEERPGRVIEPEQCDAEALLNAIRAAGITELDGTGRPTHLRLQQARERGVKVLVINGIEDEPGLARMPAWLAQSSADLSRGMGILRRLLAIQQSVLAVETPDAAAAQALLADVPAPMRPVLQILQPRYPQAVAELLLRVLAARRMDGQRPLIAADAVVFSLATVAELGRLLGSGRVVTDVLVSLAGDGLREPGNFRVPLGTPLEFALACAGAEAGLQRVLAGGPMRGLAVGDRERPILKTATAFLATAAGSALQRPQATACIRCGECVAVCPVQLHPAELGLRARKGEIEAMVGDWHLARCIACGCCDYVCPAHIPLAQMFRTAQGQWQRMQALAEAEVSA